MESASPEVAVVKMYAAREEIYPREVQGRYASLRWFFIWATQLLFYGLPWPQTVYTEIFMWIERKIEGSRSARMRLDRQPASAAKFLRKFAKHLSWGAVALWTGFTFVGYFTPIHVLAAEVMSLGLGPWEWFWVLFYSFATYGNAGWMREQVCKYMCPYARFQSAMFDKDSLIITYDQERGEPRGARNKSDPGSGKALGDCIDCSMCVQVCPTGIDIRKGLQYECIGCAACVDACNSVMDKIGAPRGLVRYWTDHAMTYRWSTDQILRHAFRPRVIIYTLVLLAIVSVFVGTLLNRTPLKMDVIRDRGSMGREIEDGMIENVYRLQIMNTEEIAHRYRISVSGIDGIALQGRSDIALAPTESRGVPINIRIPAGVGEKGSNKIFVTITDTENPDVQVSEKAVFFVPR